MSKSARQAGLDGGRLGVCRNIETLSALLDCWLEPGDVILVKGSRGMRMEQVIEALQSLASRSAKPSQWRSAA